MNENTIRGDDIIDRIKQSGIEFVVNVPDIVTCERVLWPITRDPDLKAVPVCKEDEGVSICAALSYCQRRALLLMQHTGFLDSVNAIRAIAIDYQLPICMMVGLQGMEPDRELRDSDSNGIAMMEPIMEAMGLDYAVLREPGDAKLIAPAIDRAYQESRPLVLIVARSPV